MMYDWIAFSRRYGDLLHLNPHFGDELPGHNSVGWFLQWCKDSNSSTGSWLTALIGYAFKLWMRAAIFGVHVRTAFVRIYHPTGVLVAITRRVCLMTTRVIRPVLGSLRHPSNYRNINTIFTSTLNTNDTYIMGHSCSRQVHPQLQVIAYYGT